MPKKSKPKQRTNWKQRALHCEEVISLLHQVDQVHQGKLKHAIARAESAEKQNALLLEEREAKVYRGTVCSGCYQQKCHGECFTPVRFHGDKKLFEIGDVVETPEGTFTLGDPANPPKIPDTPHWIWREGQGYVLEKSGLPYEPPYQACADNYKPKPIRTHWQRFKSWLGVWVFELVLTGAILCVLAGLVAFAYWPR